MEVGKATHEEAALHLLMSCTSLWLFRPASDPRDKSPVSCHAFVQPSRLLAWDLNLDPVIGLWFLDLRLGLQFCDLSLDHGLAF